MRGAPSLELIRIAAVDGLDLGHPHGVRPLVEGGPGDLVTLNEYVVEVLARIGSSALHKLDHELQVLIDHCRV